MENVRVGPMGGQPVQVEVPRTTLGGNRKITARVIPGRTAAATPRLRAGMERVTRPEHLCPNIGGPPARG